MRAKRIDWRAERWDFVELPWASEAHVKQFYAQTQDELYGWMDLLKRQFFNRAGNSPGWFCSEWCAAAMDIPNPQLYSPATLGDYCKERTAK